MKEKDRQLKMEILSLLPKTIRGYKTEGKLLLKRVGQVKKLQVE